MTTIRNFGVIWLGAAALFAGACGGGSPGGTSGDGGSGSLAGQIELEEQAPASGPSSIIRAHFPAPAACEPTRTVGACSVSTCPATNPTMADSAGAITVSGGTGAPVVLMPESGTNFYTGSVESTMRWQGGDAITITAAGGDVPAFMGDLVFPPLTDVTEPAVPAAGSRVSVSRSADLAVQWSNAGSSDVVVEVTQGTMVVDCSFAGADGSGVVPAAALSDLMTTSSGNPFTTLEVRTRNEQSVAAGDQTVSLAATWVGFSQQVDVQ